jgi:hypothetical protein
MLITILYQEQLSELQSALEIYKLSHPEWVGWGLFPINTISEGIYTVLVVGEWQVIFALSPVNRRQKDISIVALITPPRICPVCARDGTITQLPKHNHSGYCTAHREHNLDRKAKKSPRRKP